MPRTVLLHNPKAKRGQANLQKIAGILDAAADQITLVALEGLQEFEGPCDRLLALGGDGTVNAAVHWIARRRESGATEGEPRLGIVPRGPATTWRAVSA